MDRLLLHEARSVRDWPSTDRDQLLAVAHRDIHVARQNVADLTRNLDNRRTWQLVLVQETTPSH